MRNASRIRAGSVRQHVLGSRQPAWTDPAEADGTIAGRARHARMRSSHEIMVQPSFLARAAPLLGRLALAVISCGLALLIAEAGLRWMLPRPPATSQAEARPGFIAHDPELGWRPVPGGRGVMRGAEFDVEVTVNRQGLRGPRTYSRRPATGRPRLVVLGDSFSFGHGVRHEENWITRLEGALAPAEVINLAVTGYGTDQQLLRLERVGLGLAPDIVVLALFEGNVFRNVRLEQVGYPKPRFEIAEDGSLRLVGVPVPEAPPPAAWHQRSALGRLILGRGGDLIEHLGYGEAWPVTEAILGRMKAASEGAGARLVVLVIPKDQAVHGKGLRRRLHQRTLARIAALLERAGIEYHDLTAPLMAAAEQRLYFFTDGHWNASGHEVAAAAAARFLRPRIADLARSSAAVPPLRRLSAPPQR